MNRSTQCAKCTFTRNGSIKHDTPRFFIKPISNKNININSICTKSVSQNIHASNCSHHFLGRHQSISLNLTNKSTTRLHALPAALDIIINGACSSSPGLALGALMNSLVYILGIKVLLKGLTWPGVVSSWFLGTLSYASFGPGAYSIVCLYFIIGSLVTKLKLEQKQREGIAEARSGRRGLGSVLGSGIAGLFCALTALLLPLTTSSPSPHLLLDTCWRVGFIASFASKLADTVSSEVGKAYGKTTYLITSLKRVPRGTEGAVSAEGTLAGVVAAACIACVAFLLGQVDTVSCIWVVVAAAVANVFESVLGATVQGNVKWLTNDVVNMLQISVASGIAVALTLWSGSI